MVQQDHFDWGFRLTNLYGADYRYTTMQGVLSNQLLLRNQTNGYDPVEFYAVGYFPHWAQGTTMQVGRYISPPDIEANLAPQNFLYTHSIMFTFDCYTQMGALFTTMMSPYWTLVYGVHGGTDTALWDGSAHFPTFLLLARYVSHSNRNSVFFGVDAINPSGSFKTWTKGTYYSQITHTVEPLLWGHDNLQQFNTTWTHVFNSGFQNQFETYYLYEINAYAGGTINNYNVATGGPVYLGAGGGPGAYLPGLSSALGMVDYLEAKVGPQTFASFRLDYLNDWRGWRSGFPTSYGSITTGVTYHAFPTVELRPEVRFEKAFRAGITPYDNATKSYQTTFGMDAIFDYGNP
ncbi:MAG: outer membrane beta-barrel protein [Candidatus Eremiobacteraeota bacterium]|nr:outer membrane beta-barrel protein [Candidatus Eremiobacteraeota bacterium]